MTAGAGGPCRWLRPRSAYDRAVEDALDGDAASVESCWCLRTMEPVGPDDQLADARSCRMGRACFSAHGEGG